jgi:hypothetical protein
MSDFDQTIYDANMLMNFLTKEGRTEEAGKIRAHLETIEKSFQVFESLFKEAGFYWVTEENLIRPNEKDDVPETKKGDYPFEFPATCPYCQIHWRFSSRASESLSIRLNMCVVPETVVICPNCRKKSMICPKGKATSEDVKGAAGGTLGISFKREGAVLRKVD